MQLTSLKCPSGKKLKIISALASQWKKFGIHLNFDETGYTLRNIKKECSEECCIEMMEMWLEGKGRQPVTWATLIELLEDAEHKSIAEQLKEVVLTL